jgi:hypothetical protein
MINSSIDMAQAASHVACHASFLGGKMASISFSRVSLGTRRAEHMAVKRASDARKRITSAKMVLIDHSWAKNPATLRAHYQNQCHVCLDRTKSAKSSRKTQPKQRREAILVEKSARSQWRTEVSCTHKANILSLETLLSCT